MIKTLALLAGTGCILAQPVSAQQWKLTPAEIAESVAMSTNYLHGTLAWRAAMVEQMLVGANWAADQLKLPIKRPIQMTDLVESRAAAAPWMCLVGQSEPPHYPDTVFGTHLYNTNIPRESRLRAIKFGVYGRIDTADFEFVFTQGRLLDVMRLDAPNVERYSRNLDALIGKPSLIDSNGAYQLATQWLAAVDVDVAALEKGEPRPGVKGGHSINQLHYLPLHATNAVTLPLYYVDFGSQHLGPVANGPPTDDPLASVEILGTTKELQELTIGRCWMGEHLMSYRHPLFLITNALALIRTPDPPSKELKHLSSIRTNSGGQPTFDAPKQQ